MTPNGWQSITLGEIADLSGGTTPPKANEEYWGGEISWATPSDITSLPEGEMSISDTASRITQQALDETSLRILEPGCVLMTSRATIGEAVVNSVPMTTNQGFCNFIPGPPLASEFLAYWLRSAKNRLISLAGGSTFLEISKRTLRNMEIDLPPLPEQKTIAAILGSVDEAIQATQAVIDQTRKVKQGLLAQLLTRGIGHTRFKKTEIGEMPEEWEVAELSEVAKVIDCKHRTPKYTDHGFAVVRPRDVKEGPLDLSGCIRTSKAEYEDLVENHRPSLGDIVYSRNATFGVAAIVETDEQFTIGQDVCIISGSRLAGRFLFYLLNSRVVGQQLDLLSAGSTFKRINLKDIRRFKVPVIEEAEQSRIASIADSLSEEIALHEAQLSQFEDLKRGLMQDLLTGRVRVKGAA